VFISGACNTVSDGIAWITHSHAGKDEKSVHSQSLVVFAVANLVCVCVPTHHQPRILCSLRGHAKNVTVVRCLKSDSEVIEVLSASEDGVVKLWTHRNGEPLCAWTNTADTNMTMKAQVITMASLSTPLGDVVAASDASGMIRVWYRKQQLPSSFVHVDELRHPVAQMAHSLHFSVLPLPPSHASSNSNVAVGLWVGSVDSRIHIWTTSVAQLSAASEIILATSDTNPGSSVAPSSSTTRSTSNVFHCVGQLSGHQEWVTCIATTLTSRNSLLVASGSQDCKVRVWRVDCATVAASSSAVAVVADGDTAVVEEEEDEEEDDAEDGDGQSSKKGKKSSATIAPTDEDDAQSAEARLVFQLPSLGVSYSIFLETLLVGHEDWVTTVHWLPRLGISTNSCSIASPAAEYKHTEEFRLYSASMDRNMVIWMPDHHTGIWLPSVRVGDIGGMLGGSVGSNLLGFVSGCASPSGQDLIGVGYGGSLHMWSKYTEGSAGAVFNQCSPAIGVCESAQQRHQAEEAETWHPIPFLTGHFGVVSDCCWSLAGDLLYTVSSDQSCRLFGDVVNSGGAANAPYWCEISRPLVHGYDLNAIACVPPRQHSDSSSSSSSSSTVNHSSDFLIAIAGDEKLIRVLDAPSGVIHGLATMCHIEAAKREEHDPINGVNRRIPRAYLPELGLSSKAASLMTDQEQSEMLSRNVSSIEWNKPLLEGQLSDHTIWPGNIWGVLLVIVFSSDL
jgi:hypothetical protein